MYDSLTFLLVWSICLDCVQYVYKGQVCSACTHCEVHLIIVLIQERNAALALLTYLTTLITSWKRKVHNDGYHDNRNKKDISYLKVQRSLSITDTWEKFRI